MDDYDKALKLAEAAGGYSDEAEILLLKCANNNDGRALYALGSWRLHGVGKKSKSIEQAIDYFSRAKSVGNGDAYYELAVCYELGSGIKKSNDSALMHYMMAAMLGVKDSMFEAARMIYHHEASLHDIQETLCEEMLRVSEILGMFEE